MATSLNIRRTASFVIISNPFPSLTAKLLMPLTYTRKIEIRQNNGRLVCFSFFLPCHYIPDFCESRLITLEHKL